MRRGFTILELLVATALTALLMVAILHVISALGRSNAALARQENTGWRTDLLDALRHDLSSATTAGFRHNAVILSGHGALDRSSLVRTQEPVTVIYGVAQIHGRPWLVRTQSPRGGSAQAPWAELMCADVKSFSVQVPGARSPADEGEEAIPPVVSIIVESASDTVLNETMVLR